MQAIESRIKCSRCHRDRSQVTIVNGSTRCTDCGSEAMRRSRQRTGKSKPTVIKDKQVRYCGWRWRRDVFVTDCGNYRPENDGMKFCPYCGKKLVVVPSLDV